MADTNALVALALSLRHLDVSHVYAQTVPVVPAPFDPNRVVWADNAAEVWQRLRDDRPLYGDDAADASPAPESTAKDDADGKDKDDETTPTPEADDAATDTPSATPSAKPQPTVDPKTGLIKREDGTLIDPNTNGVVDPENGSIRDPETGQYIGIAYQYLNTTICSVPAKSE